MEVLGQAEGLPRGLDLEGQRLWGVLRLMASPISDRLGPRRNLELQSTFEGPVINVFCNSH